MPKTTKERKGKQNVSAWGPSANSGLSEAIDSNVIMSLANCSSARLSGGNDQMNSIFHLIPLWSVCGDGNWCHWPSEAPLSAAPRRPCFPNGFRSRWGERQNNAIFHNFFIPTMFTFSIQRNFDKFSMEILSLQVRMAAAAAAVDRVRFSALDAQARCITPFSMDENSIPSNSRLRALPCRSKTFSDEVNGTCLAARWKWRSASDKWTWTLAGSPLPRGENR